jgi:hypothetical protein
VVAKIGFPLFATDKVVDDSNNAVKVVKKRFWELILIKKRAIYYILPFLFQIKSSRLTDWFKIIPQTD